MKSQQTKSKHKLNNDTGEHSARIIDCGRISDNIWLGKVSKDSLLKDKVVSEKSIQLAINDLNSYYVPINSNSKVRCIDGRFDPKFDESQIGPQAPGGAPGSALAYRLGVDKEDLFKGSFLEDADAMITTYLLHNFPPGGHRDINSNGTTSVGCGAIDGMDAILATMIAPAFVEDNLSLVKLILGKRFNVDDYLHIFGAAVVINSRSKDYFKERAQIISRLESRAKDSVSVLEGSHQECLVIVNEVPHTTLATNRIAEGLQGGQAFGYDVWRTFEIAEKILPRTDQFIDRERFIMAKVMTTIATLMALTDGSLQLILRTEN